MIILVHLIYRKGQIYESFGLLLIHIFKLTLPIKQVKILKALKQLRLGSTNNMSYSAVKLTVLSFSIELIILSILLLKGAAVLYGVGLSIGILFIPDLKLMEKAKEVEAEIIKEMPNILMSLRLLVMTGMPLTMAMDTIPIKSVFSKVLHECNEAIKKGMPSSKVYTELLMICQLQAVTRFCRILIQDEKNGSKESIVLLEKLCDDIWKERKNICLKKSEASSTKLLIPMMMSLLGVLIAVTVPAVIQLFSAF